MIIPDPDPRKTFRIRPDPDPQPCLSDFVPYELQAYCHKYASPCKNKKKLFYPVLKALNIQPLLSSNFLYIDKLPGFQIVLWRLSRILKAVCLASRPTQP